ncbi:MAG: circadian clock protein KaiC [Candidatus Aenigmatarchaeota archaeon]|nr:MAG: circadian clock protein KaiC [Candidatus Aenigmarchaeota archaeon]
MPAPKKPSFPKPEPVSESSPTGIVELDRVLGGGFPKESAVLLAGTSGTGKTVFSFQWLFEGAKNGENGVYVTLTEPLFKSVKNLETLSFYDRSVLEQEKVKILDMRSLLSAADVFKTDEVIAFLEKHVKENNAKRLCIDSMTAITYGLDSKAEIRKFIFELGTSLAALGCTTVMTGEITEKSRLSVHGVEEFISDVILVLDHAAMETGPYRTVGIVKVRGRGYDEEEMSFRITKNGIIIFPKLRTTLLYQASTERVSTGSEELDAMLLGGVFRGSTTLVSGPTGTGKTVLCMQFVNEGVAKGEPCLYAGFEESRDQIIRNARSLGWDFAEYERRGLLTIRTLYPGEMMPEEHLADIKKIMEERGVKRCVVDSLSAFEASFPQRHFVDFARRLNSLMKQKGVAACFTVATSELVGTSKLTEANISTMLDNIISLRFVEISGELRHVLSIIKVRGTAHSKGLRTFSIGDDGYVIGPALSGYEGVLSGSTRKVSATVEEELQTAFSKAIGPMGTQSYAEVAKKGLTLENIESYIDGLSKKGVMTSASAAQFKDSVRRILKGEHAVGEGDIVGKFLKT